MLLNDNPRLLQFDSKVTSTSIKNEYDFYRPFGNQEIASAMLDHIGCFVDVVSDGLQALEALARNHYDLVFMDCQMPELDGYDAARAIRAGESMSTPAFHLPIIALTAHAMPGDRVLCLAAGMDDYLSKPFNIEQLQEILDKWLLPREVSQKMGA